MQKKRTAAVIIALFLHFSFCILHSAFASDFRAAEPGYDYAFPRDHGSHDEYRTEWWYYTGHLATASGRRVGFELTFFRVGVVPPDAPVESRWDLRNLALAHFAITDIDGKRFRYYEKSNRASAFTANAATGYLDVFNEGWKATTARDGAWHLVAEAGGDAIDLMDEAAEARVLRLRHERDGDHHSCRDRQRRARDGRAPERCGQRRGG